MTPALTPASRAASLLPRTMPSASSAQHALRAPRVMRCGGGAGEPHADALALGAEMLAHAQAHAQHHAARAQRVVRHPVDELRSSGLSGGTSSLSLDVLEPVVEPRIGLRVLRPHHAGRLARAERHRDDVAGRELEPVRHPIGIGLVERDRHQDIDDAPGHAACADWTDADSAVKEG